MTLISFTNDCNPYIPILALMSLTLSIEKFMHVKLTNFARTILFNITDWIKNLLENPVSSSRKKNN